jgi:hypothetical protein
MGKVHIESNIILDISPYYHDLPRKAKKAEKKRIEKEITKALERYIITFKR